MLRVAMICACGLVIAGVARATPPIDRANYRYAGEYTTTVATLEIDQATLYAPRAQVALWLGAADKKGSWVQAGVYEGPNDGGRMCVYVEVNDARSGSYQWRCLWQTSPGEKVTIRLTFSDRHGTVIWADGRPVESVELRAPTKHYAISEKYLAAKMKFRILAPDGSLRYSW